MSSSSSKPVPAAMEWETIHVGVDKHSLRIPKPPPVSDSTHLKARAYDYFATKIAPLTSKFTTSELVAAAGDSFHISTSAADDLATSLTESVRGSMFDVANLEGIRFSDTRGDKTTIELDPTQRSDGIRYFTVAATIQPSLLHACFTHLPTKIVEYTLRLPQQSRGTTAPGGSSGASSASASASAPAATSTSTSTSGPVTPVALSSTFSATTSPRMNRLLSSSSSGSGQGLTYADTLDFLDHQSEFDRIFCNSPARRPHIFDLKGRKPTAQEITEDLEAKLTAYFTEIHFTAFLHFYRNDYVGDSIGSGDAAEETIDLILEMKCETRLPGGKKVILTPDDLYARYVEILPLMGPDSSQWRANIALTYHSALTDEVKEVMKEQGYTKPKKCDMKTAADEIQQLQIARSAAKKAMDKIDAESKRMKHHMEHHRSLLVVQPAASPAAQPPQQQQQQQQPLVAASYYGQSPAEGMLQAYNAPQYKSASPASSASSSSGPRWNTDPPPPGVLPLPVNFRGCMACGNPNAMFRTCPCNDGSTERNKVFFRALHHYKPHTKKYPDRPADTANQSKSVSWAPDITTSAPAPTVAASQALLSLQKGDGTATTQSRRAVDNRPAWMSTSTSTTSTVTPTSEKKDDKSDVLSCLHTDFQFLSLHSNSADKKRPMPISINNGLPTIYMQLGLREAKPDMAVEKLGSLLMLGGTYDTGSSMNLGNAAFHLWIMENRPGVIASYESFDDKNPFEPIKLLGALCHNDAATLQKAGFPRYHDCAEGFRVRHCCRRMNFGSGRPSKIPVEAMRSIELID